MEFITVYLVVMALIALSGVAYMIAIAGYLQGRGYPINWFLIKLLIVKYVSQYRELTIRETGRVGPLFWGFVVCMNVALVMGVVALAVLA
jgi:hypothetical protein